MKTQKAKQIYGIVINKLPLLLLLFVIFMAFSHNYSRQIEDCNSRSVCSVNSIRLTNNTADCEAGKDVNNNNSACCGGGAGGIDTSINFGCKGQGNDITDLIFALIRFLSDGVGLIIVASVIIGGIQYIFSRGDPNATGAAVKRLTSAVVALLVFIFAYAILNYVIPVGFFKL